MKKKVLAAILIAVGVLTGCGNSEPISSPIQTVEAEPIATDTGALLSQRTYQRVDR